MKKLAPAGLLILLLYHTFGLSIAVLFFEKDYQLANQQDLAAGSVVMKMYLPELPYAGNLQATEAIEALIRRGDEFYNPTQILHEADTLYVTLTVNTAARDRFFELAGAMEQISSPEQAPAKSPYGKVLKLMSSLLQNYLPVHDSYQFNTDTFYSTLPLTRTPTVFRQYCAASLLQQTPPPEQC